MKSSPEEWNFLKTYDDMPRNIENLNHWARENRAKNRDKINARKRAEYQTNKDKILTGQKAYYEANKVEINARECARQKAKRAVRNADPVVIAARAARKAELKVIRSAQMKERTATRWAGHTPVAKTKKRIREYNQKYYSNPKTRAERQAYGKAYRQRPEVRARLREKENRQRKEDPQFVLRQGLRCRIRSALAAQSTYKTETTETLLGCTIEEFKARLQSLFLPGMHWNNRQAWHIDHRIPCARFDLTDPAQQRACFHFTNLQPLWKIDNLRKGSKLPTTI